MTERVPVPDSLRSRHPLVARLRAKRGEPETLRRLDVTRYEMSRALRIVQALIDEAMHRGYLVRESNTAYQGGQREVCIAVTGHEYALTVRERNSHLQVWLPREFSGRRQWNDGPRGSLESKLGEVLHELESRAERAEEHLLARQAEELKRQQAWEEAIEQAQTRYAEAYRTEMLRQQVDSWRLARDIRAYCFELRAAVKTTVEGTRSHVESWIAWAERYADEIDPIVHPQGEPEVPEPKPDALRQFLDCLSPYGPPGWP